MCKNFRQSKFYKRVRIPRAVQSRDFTVRGRMPAWPRFMRGGDFGDGLIAFEGQRFGGQTFISFDEKVDALVKKQGRRQTFSCDPDESQRVSGAARQSKHVGPAKMKNPICRAILQRMQ